MPLLGNHRTRRPMNTKEARIVAEDPPPTNNGVPEEAPARQDVDVLLDVSELEVDKIHLKVRDLRAHVSVVAELASLVSLQVCVDARLGLVELEIEGVRAKVLLKVRLKVRLDNVRAILVHALDTVAEHPEILESLTRALDELLTGTLGNALGALEDVLGDLDVGGTVDEALRGSLEEVRDTLQEILDQAGGQTQAAGGGPALPGGRSSSAMGEPSSGAPQEEKQE
jgi:hypothetical protein